VGYEKNVDYEIELKTKIPFFVDKFGSKKFDIIITKMKL